MGIVLGLNCNHADSSACIVKNGKLVTAIEEERINRIKHWAGIPYDAILLSLKESNTKLSEITDIAINTNPFSNLFYKTTFFFKNYLFGKKKYEIIERLKKKASLKSDLKKTFKNDLLSENVNFHYVDHHKAHLSSAFFPSGFKKASGLSIDGFGDFCSISLSKCENENINIFKKIYFPDSLGVFYEAFTQLIGFNKYGDEYKMMGLSSYGKPEYFNLIKKNIFINNAKNIKLNLNYFNHADKNYSYRFQGKPIQNQLYKNKLKDVLNIKDLSNEKITEIHKNIACSVQKIFEDKLLEICSELRKSDFSSNLVFAGGCALNSLANKKIHDSNLFNKIFIPYAPGDGGGSIGAALYVSKKKYKKYKLTNIISPYVGPEFDNISIENDIKKYKDKYDFSYEFIEEKKELYKKIANKIFENKIIGHFNGKMEFGARALGNRSILANPCNPEIKDIINKKIKRRESFRPFAPAILFEKKSEWFNNKRSNPYMSAVEDILENKKKFIPGVTHIDGTGRVQTVTKEINSDFYMLIEEFANLSNVPIILNTSFNENEPIVLNSTHALNCFFRTNMDILVMNNYIIYK